MFYSDHMSYHIRRIAVVFTEDKAGNNLLRHSSSPSVHLIKQGWSECVKGPKARIWESRSQGQLTLTFYV